MTQIPIEEEYGYARWIWTTPDDFDTAGEKFFLEITETLNKISPLSLKETE